MTCKHGIIHVRIQGPKKHQVYAKKWSSLRAYHICVTTELGEIEAKMSLYVRTEKERMLFPEQLPPDFKVEICPSLVLEEFVNRESRSDKNLAAKSTRKRKCSENCGMFCNHCICG